MSIWDNIKSGARSLWSSIKNYFSWDTYTDTVANDTTQDTWKQTLNQQIINWNITKPTTTTTNTVAQTSGFDTLRESMNAQQWQSIPTIKAEPVVIEDKEDESTLSKVNKWISGAASDIADFSVNATSGLNSWLESISNSRKIKKDYRDKEELYAIWYNPDNRNVYYLDLNEDRGVSDFDRWTIAGTKDMFNQLLSEADLKINQPWATQAEKTAAWVDFYNQAKNLFRIRSDDRYKSKSWFWRRDEMYTQDELDMLSKTGNTEEKRYEPTFDEFQDYVSMYLRNMLTLQELWVEYSWTPSNGTEVFDMGDDLQSTRMENMRNIALKWIDEYLEPMRTVNPSAATQEEIVYSSTVLWDQFSRWYNRIAPIYRAEQEILSRDQSTWSWQDRYVLWQANVARQMDEQFAQNINELFRQNLLYWTDKKWNVVNTIDMFENGESLNDILTRWLRDLAWEDKKRYSEHQSHLDIAENFANETLYTYKQDKAWPLAKAWNKLEYFFEPVGATLWEAWQAARAAGTTALGVVSLWLLSDKLTRSYMDQDSTVFRLLETDDWNTRRTIKKYYLEATEYTPEVLGNLIPDIMLFQATGPWAIATLSRHAGDIWRTTKVVRAAEWANMLSKMRAILRWTDYIKAAEDVWLSAGKFKEIINATKAAKWGKYYQRLKTWAQLLDRMVTQTWLWQFMDAQWSAYDTEPYSEASFLMSVIGSWVFDIMPDLVRLWTWRWWRQLLTWRYWDNIWDLARYIDSSPEAAENIAKALRKGTWEIGVEELKAFVRDFWVIEDAAKQAYEWLTEAEKQAIGKMTKWLAYNYINQAFWANSTMWKRVRKILENKNSNIADVVKYIAKVPWDVSVWPYVSTIRLKNWTPAHIIAKNGEYSPLLDSAFNWWFDSRVANWFSQADLDKLSKIDWYSDIEKNKWKWFYSVTTDDWTRYYLNKNWLNHFWLKAESITLDALWVSLKEAENTREALMAIKGANWVKISDAAVDNIANSWWYEEINLKVKEVLWC